jgi:bifunctional non-homologous end joining protein LigD
VPDRLGAYRAKRDPARTPEPGGDATPAAGAGDGGNGARFVVQEHSATRLHWDLRLERDGVLVSFAVPNGLPLEPGRNHLAVHTEDHPLEYLEFHGEIPKGSYGAGTMEVFDRGTYDTLKWTDRKIEVHLHGERVDARYALFPLDKGEDAKDWMIHRMDPPADPAAEPMPELLVPMLARAGGLPRDDAAWGFEIKWDGVRAICRSEPGTLRLHSRNGNDITRRYPELARLNRALHHHRVILDGEIVAFGADGKPSFAALQRRMHLGDERRARRLADEAPVSYVIFDLLWLDGHPLVDAPYAERRAALAELALDGARWQAPDHVVGHGADVLAAAREQGLEGVIAKRLDSAYEPGRRSAAWIKVKLLQREALVVCGWLPGEGRRRDRIGALLLGVHEREPVPGLRYAGRVGTGFTQDELDRLAGLLGPLEQPAAPFDLPGPKPPREAVWVRPELVCDVEFAEWTPDGQLRHPSYKGLHETALAVRPDRTRKNGALGEIDGREVKLSNLDKVLYPAAGFTKRDVIDYHVAIAPVLLPHLTDRALTLKRYPSGVEGAFFYEKNAPSHRPEWVRTARVGDIDYVVVDQIATLVWLANLADLELHTSLGRVDDLEHPTTLAFDLDPGPPAGLLECCRVALWLQGMFEGLGLVSCAKTSGSKGMQVYLPLDGEATWAQTKAFSKAVAELLEQAEPGLVVSRQTKAIRKGKVLVDWSQNDEHKTTVNVYSLRAREQPTVSTPLTWDEIREAHDAGDIGALQCTAEQVLARVERLGDLFAPVLSVRQSLPAL